MDGWHLALYAFAIYLALRTLLALMRAHEQDLRRKLAQTPASPPNAPARAPSGSPRG
jgi:hypothetical protein